MKLHITFISEENRKGLEKRKFTEKEPRKRRKYFGKRDFTAEENKTVIVAASCKVVSQSFDFVFFFM